MPFDLVLACLASSCAPGQLQLQDRIEPREEREASGFGGSVAVAGDVLVVGCARDVPWPGTDPGVGPRYDRVQVHRLDRERDAWTFEQLLETEDPGYATVVDTDGKRIAVGVSTTREGGVVLIYRREGKVWELEARLEGPGERASERMRFGDAVAIDGDSLIVGAPDYGSFLDGAAFCYLRVDERWVLRARLEPSAGIESGAVVDVHEDKWVVGSPGIPFTCGGWAFVYESDWARTAIEVRANRWTRTATGVRANRFSSSAWAESWSDVTPEVAWELALRVNSGYGRQVAVHAGRIAVCDNLHEVLGRAEDTGLGTVHVYGSEEPESEEQPYWREVQQVASPGTIGPRSGFGVPLALSDRLLVAVERAFGSAEGPMTDTARTVHVFELSDRQATLVGSLSDADVDADLAFGSALATSGSTVVVGAPRRKKKDRQPGAVFVYRVE